MLVRGDALRLALGHLDESPEEAPGGVLVPVLAEHGVEEHPLAVRRYGTARVCQLWEVPRSTVYARRARASRPAQPAAKRGPNGAGTDAALTEQIRAVLARSPFIGEGYRKAWARLRLAGVRTSKGRVLRLMRAAGLLAPHGGASCPRRRQPSDGRPRGQLNARMTFSGSTARFSSIRSCFDRSALRTAFVSNPRYVRMAEPPAHAGGSLQMDARGVNSTPG